MLEQTIQFEVTVDNIIGGIRCNSIACPVANALYTYCYKNGIYNSRIGVTGSWIALCGNKYIPDAALAEQIRNFDLTGEFKSGIYTMSLR